MGSGALCVMTSGTEMMQLLPVQLGHSTWSESYLFQLPQHDLSVVLCSTYI